MTIEKRYLKSSTVDEAKRRAREGSRRVAGVRRHTSHSSPQALLQVFKNRAGKLPVVLEEKRGKENVADSPSEDKAFERAGESKAWKKFSSSASGPLDGSISQKGFFFQQRHGKVDLRRLARVDLEQVVEQVDVEALQQHLENLTFGELDVRDVRTLTDENFVKLFRLTQLTMEYLLNVQHTLFSYSCTLEEQLATLEKEFAVAESKISQQETELETLKHQIRQKRRTLKTYEFLLTQNNKGVTSIMPQSTAAAIDEQEKILKQARDLQQESLFEEKQHRLEVREKHIHEQHETLREQTEQLRRMLQEEAESMKKTLMQDLEEQRNALQSREQVLKEREIALQKDIERKEEMSSQRNKKPQGGKLSLAGSRLEDDTWEESDIASIQEQVDEILQASGSLNDLKHELSKVVDENSRLRTELAFVQQLMAQKPQPSPPPLPSPVQKTQPQRQVEQAAFQDTTKTDHEKLMTKISAGQVSRDLADRRSMQLRRVLRLFRRRLQSQCFMKWRMFTREQLSQEREKKLLIEMERLRARVTNRRDPGLKEVEEEEEEEEKDELSARFSPSYDWQLVPRHLVARVKALEPMLEWRVHKDGTEQARIPVVWALQVHTSVGDVTVGVTKNMTIRDVREKIAQQLDRPIEKVVLQERQEGAVLEDNLTVEESKLHTLKPFIDLSADGLSEASIQRIVKEYVKDNSSPGKSPVPSQFSPVANKPHIKARWFHSNEDIETEQLKISQELSRSISSTGELSSSIGAKSPGFNPKHTVTDKTIGDIDDEEEVSEHETPTSQPRFESVPVNFGDDFEGSSVDRSRTTDHNTSANNLSRASSQNSMSSDASSKSNLRMRVQAESEIDSSADFDESSYSTASKVSTTSANLHKLQVSMSKSPMTREALLRRHQKTMSRFTKVGLIRRAQINTLNLSDDSGSSRTATSVSSSGGEDSEGVDSLAKSGKSFFDVEQRADRYDGSSELASSTGGLDYTDSTVENTPSKPSEAKQQQKSAVSSLLDELEDDSDSDAE